MFPTCVFADRWIPRGKATNSFKQRGTLTRWRATSLSVRARVFSEQRLANGIESDGCNSLGGGRESLVSPSHRDKCLFGRVHGTNLSHLMTSANTRRLNGAGSLEPKEECRAIAKRRREARIYARESRFYRSARESHTPRQYVCISYVTREFTASKSRNNLPVCASPRLGRTTSRNTATEKINCWLVVSCETCC